MIFAIAMGALSVFRGYQQSQTQKQMADVAEKNAQYASELAVNNAEIERQNQSMRKDADFETKRRRQAIQEASYATSGILLDGTPSQYLQAQVETDEMNMDRQDQASYQKQLGILYGGQVQKTNLLNQADAYRQSANSALLGGVIGAGASYMKYGGADSFSWMSSGKSSTGALAGASTGVTAGSNPTLLTSTPNFLGEY